MLDNPNRRSSHSHPTPKGGGIGILAAFIFSSLFLKISYFFWLPVAFVSLISFFGDRIELSPKIRLLLQFIMTLILVQHLLSSIQPSIFFFIFISVFIVATANWYNFMDGINGIAGISGIVGFSLLAIFNFFNNSDSNLLILSICMAVSCLGFLPFNFPKAKVFMGDVGSILLGFVFAAVVVMLSNTFFDVICLAGLLFPFYADELVTISIRLRDGENLLKPHRRHFYQLLANERGIPHWKVSIGYGIFQLIIGLSVLLLMPVSVYAVLSLLLTCLVIFSFVDHFIRRRVEKKIA
jgi:UDP-N-acetylmuramyl pentapeptide phosphotransferase/UDP-N-acetylglucosamine-1-phosphate transferase